MFRKRFRLKEGQRFSGSIGETVEVCLSQDSLLRIEGDGRGLEILGRTGILWLSQEKDCRDHFLRSGEQFKIDRRGLVILQAMEAAKFRIRRAQGAEGAGNKTSLPLAKGDYEVKMKMCDGPF